MVFYTAAERVHAAKALGEAQRTASRSVADRAVADLADAKAPAKAATAAADKVRGRDAKACKATCLSIKASETAAIERLARAEAALAAAQGRAVTEASLRQPDWLQPLAFDLAGIVLVGVGFGLGRGKAPASVPPSTRRGSSARADETPGRGTEGMEDAAQS